MLEAKEIVKNFQTKLGCKADGIIGPKTLQAFREFYSLNKVQAAHFFGQIHNETGGFKVFSENLNYSAKGLRNTFSKYFKTDQEAEEFAYKPEKIANVVYGGRMGNIEEGDGWKFRGRGALQLTGRNNYTAFSEYVGDSLVLEDPDVVCDKYAFDTAIWFFEKNVKWETIENVDLESIRQVTRKVNGGYIGLDNRIKLVNHYYEMQK